jgi:hypothetical protein
MAQAVGMAMFVPFSRDQSFLLPPDLKDWLPADVLAHVVVAAVDRVGLDASRSARGQVARRSIPRGGWRC